MSSPISGETAREAMDSVRPIDKDNGIDWGKTSADYALYRPGPPESFYQKLSALGIGLRGQRILDLGTGTGVLARQFATQGAVVAGIDISGEQIQAATTLAGAEGLKIDFRVAPAEQVPFPDGAFDVVTANQCWLYFDKEKAIAEARRLLNPVELLVISHFSWLPRLDMIAAATEQLVLKYNPHWTGADFSGDVPPLPRWTEGVFKLRAFFYYDEAVPFTRESWRGRIRACRGIGAALSAKEVQRFDQEHDALLKELAAERFIVLHRIDCRILEFKP